MGTIARERGKVYGLISFLVLPFSEAAGARLFSCHQKPEFKGGGFSGMAELDGLP